MCHYSLVPNRRPPRKLIFSKFSSQDILIPTPSAIKFWGQFHTKAFMNDVNNHFSLSSLFLICYYWFQRKLHCLEAFQYPPSIKFKAIFQPPVYSTPPPLIRFWGFFQTPDYSNPPSIRHQRVHRHRIGALPEKC